MKVPKSHTRLYKIELEEVSSLCLVAELTNPTWLWHARMGHVNFRALKEMSDKQLVERMAKINIPTQPCEGCLVGKQSRKPY